MERHVTPESRLAGMEDATATALAANEKATQLEQLMNNAETSAMNDTAQMEIYGSGARTYTDASGEVVASPDKPEPGKLEEIRSNRRYGKTEAEREAVAQKYEEDVNSLLEDGYELTQAKLIMDLREKDTEEIGKLAGKYIADGENPLIAKKKAKDLYKKKEAKRLKMIKEEGLRNTAEYDAFRKDGTSPTVTTPEAPEGDEPEGEGNDLNAEGGVGDEPYGPEKPSTLQLEMDAANERVAVARDKYIELSSKRRRLSFGFRKANREKAIEDALAEYNKAKTFANELAGEMFERDGASEEDILAFASLTTATETVAVYDGMQQQQESLANSNAFMKKFNNLWTKWSEVDEEGKKPRFGRLKKIALMAGIGAGAAVGASFAAAGLGLSASFAAPALLAARFGRGQAMGRLRHNAEAGTQAGIHNQTDRDAVLRAVSEADSLEALGAVDIAGASHEKTKEYVKKNRRRTIGSAALGGAGFAAVDALGLGLNEFGKMDVVKDGVKQIGNLAQGVGDTVADGAEVVGDVAGDAWDKIKDIDINPFDGDGLDLNPFNNETSQSGIATGEEPWTPEARGIDVDVDVDPDAGSAPEVEPAADEIEASPEDEIAEIVDGRGDNLDEVAGEQAETQAIVGNEFNVESGNGFIQEINDFAEANGMSRNDSISTQVFNEARAKFGDDLLTGSEYVQNGDLRISSAGQNAWNPGVAEFMLQRMQELAEAQATS